MDYDYLLHASRFLDVLRAKKMGSLPTSISRSSESCVRIHLCSTISVFCYSEQTAICERCDIDIYGFRKIIRKPLTLNYPGL